MNYTWKEIATMISNTNSDEELIELQLRLEEYGPKIDFKDMVNIKQAIAFGFLIRFNDLPNNNNS